MILGLSKEIAHEDNAMKDAAALAVDFSEVPPLDGTASLYIENIENMFFDSHYKRIAFDVVGASSKIQHRLQSYSCRHLMLGQNQNPRRERRRFAPPFSSWVLCPNTLGDSYNAIQKGEKLYSNPKLVVEVHG